MFWGALNPAPGETRSEVACLREKAGLTLKHAVRLLADPPTTSLLGKGQTLRPAQAWRLRAGHTPHPAVSDPPPEAQQWFLFPDAEQRPAVRLGAELLSGAARGGWGQYPSLLALLALPPGQDPRAGWVAGRRLSCCLQGS